MTIRDFKRKAASSLVGIYPDNEAVAIVSRLLQNRLGVEEYKILAEPQMGISPEITQQLESDLGRLGEGMPLQYVLGFAEFCGSRFKVSPACLIPRQETEELVDLIGSDMDEIGIPEHGFNILDLCTGSGCIAWSLAKFFPEAHVFACDISNDALNVACKQRVKVQGAKPVFFLADILAEPPAGLPQFDLIVSNPPYVMECEKAEMRRDTLEYEPSLALFVPDDDPLKFYSAVAEWARMLLKPSGRIYCEINEKLGPQTAAVFAGAGTVEVISDLNGKERFVCVRP